MKKVGRKANPSPYPIIINRTAQAAAPSPLRVTPNRRRPGPAYRPTIDCALLWREITQGQLSRHALSAASISFSLMERSRE
jgi:hypothetical protein